LLVGLVVLIALAAALAPQTAFRGRSPRSEGRGNRPPPRSFVGSYLAWRSAGFPALSIDRAGIALVGPA